MNEKDVGKIKQYLKAECEGGYLHDFHDFAELAELEAVDDYLDILAKDISALRDEPQVDEEGLLSIDELCYIKMQHVLKAEEERKDIADYVLAALKAQLSADNARWQKRVEELIHDIEVHSAHYTANTVGMLVDYTWWQSLKSKIVEV